MLKLSALEFFFRTIPESFLCVFLAYIIYSKIISKISIVKASVLFAITTYLIRLLPISYGINTVISMIAFILIAVYIMKMSINVSIISIFISVISIYFCEWLNIIILNNLFGIQKFNNDYLKFLFTIPSLFMFGIIVLLIYMFINKFVRR